MKRKRIAARSGANQCAERERGVKSGEKLSNASAQGGEQEMQLWIEVKREFDELSVARGESGVK